MFRMPNSKALPWILGVAGLFVGLQAAPAQVVISEILFNVPGADLPHEYIELRGPANLALSPGTFLVVAEGDTNGNSGTIQNVFDLSNRRLGGNGFLLLLQKTNSYSVNPGATVLVNTDSGPGFGSGSSSSIEHKGENDQTDLENGSCTFFLIQTPDTPSIGADIDTDNNGVLDGTVSAQWTVLDSIGVLDNDGLGDIAYGAINFRRNSAATASGTIVACPFTAEYIGRAGNTTGAAATDWVISSNLEGTSPNWLLGDPTDALPTSFASKPLNHLGGPNFGASQLPGVIIGVGQPTLTVAEDNGTTSYLIQLAQSPAGPVQISVTADPQLEVQNGGSGFKASLQLTLTTTNPAAIQIRARADSTVEPSPHPGLVHHQIVASGDPAQYPTSLALPSLPVGVLDNDPLLLSELKVNPPGPDEPFEFIELRGVPNAPLSQVYVLAIEGDAVDDPGRATAVFDLTGQQLGANGLLLLVATNHPYTVPAQTAIATVPQLTAGGAGLGNGSLSLLLVTSTKPIVEGTDLDEGDNGILEDLPAGSTVLDAVGWVDGDTNDLVFGGVDLSLGSGTPDGAMRLPNDNTPLSTPAWMAGNLLGNSGEANAFDPNRSTPNVIPGTALSPGRLNNTAPSLSPLSAFSGVIDDPTNPRRGFSVADAESLPGGLVVAAASSNPAVIDQDGVRLTPLAPGQYELALEPIGVGYATITLTASDGDMIGYATFEYAASAAGAPTSRFHTGITDASTAIPLSPELMLVGDDENQTLRLYSRLFSGAPLAGFDMSAFLALTDYENGRPREVDIEGSARVGNRIYWIGSHSHANIGEIRTNRSRLFATDLSGSGTNIQLTFVGMYEHLKADLIDWDSNNRHGKGPAYYGLEASAADGVLPKEPHGAGFNIEGLTMAPGSTTTAWICFRAPIVPATNRLYALIVPVTNFSTLAISGAAPGSARFGSPIELDLQGRGVRSIEGDGQGFLIITGPPGDTPTPFPPYDFKIYTWSGRPEDRPDQRAADLTGLNPEALVELPPRPWADPSLFQLLSDNGRTVFYGDGITGKDLPKPPFKKFRSDWITLGPVVTPEPIFTDIIVTPTTITLNWRSVPGRSYRLLAKEELSDDTWAEIASSVPANSPLVTFTQPRLNQSQTFYRVELMP